MKLTFFTLLKKDFRLMLAARFFLLAAGSLALYSCYINFVYVKLDDEMFPVCCFDPDGRLEGTADPVINVNTIEELTAACGDGLSVGIDLSGETPRIQMVSCGIETLDNLRAACAASYLTSCEINFPAASPQMSTGHLTPAILAGAGY